MATSFALAANFGSVSSGLHVIRIAAPTSGILKLVELHVTNDTDETSEMLPFSIKRATGTAGVGSALTPVVLDGGGQNSAGAFSGFSALYNLSTPETEAGVVWREAINILSGFHFVPVPESRPIVSGGNRIICELETGPTNTLSLSVNAVVQVEA